MISRKKTRDSNIELCRIVCMILIIAHHCVLHGGAINMNYCGNKIVAYFFIPGGKLCFDTFIAISMWYMVEQSFKVDRFLKVWCEVLFYSILTTFLALIMGSQLSIFEIGSAFFPICGGVQGYAQTYLAFYLLVPFLAKVTRSITKNQNIMIIVVLSLFIFVSLGWQSIIWTEQSVYCRLVLFVYIYFLMLYLKKYPIKICSNKWIMCLVVIGIWSVIFIQNFSMALSDDNPLKYISPLVSGENALFNIIGGIALFFFFKELKIKQNKWINFFGSTTLAVLLIHDGHFFRNWTWRLVHTSDWHYSKLFVLYIIVCAIGIYIVCSFVDFFRKKCLEKPFFKSKIVTGLCDRWNKFIED